MSRGQRDYVHIDLNTGALTDIALDTPTPSEDGTYVVGQMLGGDGPKFREEVATGEVGSPPGSGIEVPASLTIPRFFLSPTALSTDGRFLLISSLSHDNTLTDAYVCDLDEEELVTPTTGLPRDGGKVAAVRLNVRNGRQVVEYQTYSVDMAQLRNKHCTRLHALLGELAAGGIGTELTVSKANAVLDTVVVDSEVVRHRVVIAAELVDDIARLDTILKASKKRVEQAVSASGTTLTDIVGIGPINAATILGYSGDIERFATKAQFASCNGTAPIEASSGGRVRHRLNPRGNRKINHALHVAAICQLRYEGEGRTYYDRKVAEGKSSKEAIRALKRRISDRVFRVVVDDARRTELA